MEGILTLLMKSVREKRLYFASLDVLGFNNVSDISVSSMPRNNRVSHSQSPCFMRFCTSGSQRTEGLCLKVSGLFQRLEPPRSLSHSI